MPILHVVTRFIAFTAEEENETIGFIHISDHKGCRHGK